MGRRGAASIVIHYMACYAVTPYGDVEPVV
jgi:hypothetical protein